METEVPEQVTADYIKPAAEWNGGGVRRLVGKAQVASGAAATSHQSFASAASHQDGLDSQATNPPSLETTLTNSAGFRAAAAATKSLNQAVTATVQPREESENNCVAPLPLADQLERVPGKCQPPSSPTLEPNVVLVEKSAVGAQLPTESLPKLQDTVETTTGKPVPPPIDQHDLTQGPLDPQPAATVQDHPPQISAKGSLLSLMTALRRPSFFPEFRFPTIRKDETRVSTTTTTTSSGSLSRHALVTLSPPEEPGFIPPLWHPAIPCLGRIGNVIRFQSGPNMIAGQKAKITIQNTVVRCELMGLPTQPGIYSDLALLARPSTLERSHSSAATSSSSGRVSSLDRSFRPASTLDRSLSASGRRSGTGIKSMNGPTGELKVTEAMMQARAYTGNGGSLSRRTRHLEQVHSSGRFSAVSIVNDSQFVAPLGTAFTEGYLLGCSPPLALEEHVEMVTSGTLPEWFRGSLYLCGPSVNELEAVSLGVKNGKPLASFRTLLDPTSFVVQKVDFRTGGSARYMCHQHTTNASPRPRKSSLVDRLLRRRPPVQHTVTFKTAMTLSIQVFHPQKLRKQNKSSQPISALALKTDTGMLQLIDPATLGPVSQCPEPVHSTWNPGLAGEFGSVHSRTSSPESIHLLQRASELRDKYHVQLFSEDSAHRRGGDLVCALDVRGSQPLYLPQVVTTTNYLVLIVCPTRWVKFGTDMQWDPASATYFYVVDRKTKKHVATYRGDPMHFMHAVNAFDTAIDTNTEWSDIDIVVDLCASRAPVALNAPLATEFDGMPYVRRYTLSQVLAVSESQGLGSGYTGQNKRSRKWWMLGLGRRNKQPAMTGQGAPSPSTGISPSPSVMTSAPSTGATVGSSASNANPPSAAGGARPRAASGRKAIPLVQYDVRSGPGLELPVTNPLWQGKESYKYIFGVRVGSPGLAATALVKINVHQRASMEWQVQGCFPGGPVVVPRPQATAEDDAVVLSVVLDTMARRSFVLVLDAQSFREVARVSLGVGQVMPFAYHGIFAPIPSDSQHAQHKR